MTTPPKHNHNVPVYGRHNETLTLHMLRALAPTPPILVTIADA